MQAAGDAPIIDPRTQSQFDSALRVAEIELTNWKLAKLDDSFPGYKTSRRIMPGDLLISARGLKSRQTGWRSYVGETA